MIATSKTVISYNAHTTQQTQLCKVK